MKLKLFMATAALLGVVSLVGCGPKHPAPAQYTTTPATDSTTTPATDSTTVPSTAPTAAPTAPSTEPTEPVRELTMVVTADTIGILEDYPALERVNLTGSTCYAQIRDYMARHPEVEVLYTVDLGKTTVRPDVPTLQLTENSYEYATLCAALPHLTQLNSLSLPATNLTPEQLDTIRALVPELLYTIQIGGELVYSDTTALDLTAGNAAQYLPMLAYLPDLQNIQLSSDIPVATVKEFRAATGATIHYEFQLFGKTVSTADERIEFIQQDIGNQGEQALRDALDILNCKYLLLDDCGLDNEILASIRADYPETEVVWRIHVWKRSWLTDTEVLRAVYHVDDSNSAPFQYLTKVKYMDLGHNTEMVDISFCAFMPDLEIAILSGAPIVDLTPLKNCKKLEFLELAWCGLLKDITPLAHCDGLKYLNLGHTDVDDLTPLAGLGLEMLSFVNSGNKVGFTEADWQQIQAMLPDCWITYTPLKDSGATPYSKGWRYKQDGGYTPIYRKVRDVFGYDDMVV